MSQQHQLPRPGPSGQPPETSQLGRCYKNCPEGYTNTGEFCFRGVSTLGLDAMSCRPGEFFKTGRYRARSAASVVPTSSPSMDISKASNFERFVCDLVDRDPGLLASLWRSLDATGEFDLAGTPHFGRVAEFGFVSGRSTHADRLATIREVDRRYGVVIDPHTANGIKVGLDYLEADVPLVCLETAQPAKFEETIREALGRAPERPAAFAGLESRPRRFEVVDPDHEAVKRYIAEHAT